MALNDLDSSQTDGTPASPNTGGSAGNGDSGGSFDASKLQTTIEALTKRLDEVDSRSKALQSDKDRGITKTKSEVEELKRKFAEIEKLKKSGLDEDTAFEELSFRDEIRAVREQLKSLSPAQPSTAGNGAGAVADKAKVIADYGLDGNDPEVIAEIVGKNFNSQLEAENAALKLAYRRAKPTPSSVAASTAVVGSTPQIQNEGELVTRLAQLQKEPTKNREAIKELEKKLNW